MKMLKKTIPQPPPAGAFLYDERKVQTRRPLTKKLQLNTHLLHGAPGTGLPLPGVLCVGCPSWVRSIGLVRRCVGEYGGAGVEKNTKIIYFGEYFDQKFRHFHQNFFLRVARGETEVALPPNSTW